MQNKVVNEHKINISQARIGNKISRDIVDKDNKIIAKKDMVLDEETLDILILNSVEEIWIYDDNNIKENEIKNTVDRIFSRVQTNEFMQKIYKIVLDFRTKNNQ